MTNERFLTLAEECFAALPGNRVFLEREEAEVPVLEAPEVGFAAADDPLFTRFSDPDVIGADFRPPRKKSALPRERREIRQLRPMTTAR